MSCQVSFADEVAEVIRSSEQWARHLGHAQLHPEHLLLGMLNLPACAAAKLLVELNWDVLQMHRALEEGALPRTPLLPETASMPLTKDAEEILRSSYDEAAHCGHDRIGSEHILLSLLRDGSSEIARLTLRDGAISYADVRKRL